MLKQEINWNIMREYDNSWKLIYEWWYAEKEWKFLRSWKWVEYNHNRQIKYDWFFKNGQYHGFWRCYTATRILCEWSFIDWVNKGYWKIYDGQSVFYIWEIDILPNGKWTIFRKDGKRAEWIFKNWKIIWECKTYDCDGTYLMDKEPEPEFMSIEEIRKWLRY